MEKISSGRNNNFNSLRFLFATLVLLSHSPELTDGNRNREILTQLFHTLSFGELAVDCFFILSGFLIVQSWDRDPFPLDFLKKRVLRIYPGFITAALLSAIIVGPMGSDAERYFSQFQWPQFFLGLVQLQIYGIPPVFKDQPYPILNAPLWTISYEFFCYLLTALLGILGAVKNRRVWLIFSITVLFSSFFISLGSNLPNRSSDFVVGNIESLLRLLTFFCAGSCFYLFRERIIYKRSGSLIASALLFLCMFREESVQFGLAIFGTYTLLCIAFAEITLIDKFKTYSDVSYGIYLYGWPLQKLTLWYFPTISPWLLFLFCLFLAYVIGLLSWHLIERPFLRLKPGKRQTK